MSAVRAGILSCVALGAALSLISCGGGSSSGDRSTIAARVAAGPAAAHPTRSCGAELQRFIRSLDGLRDQLAVGLTYDQYLENVRRLQRAYRGIPVEDEPARCVIGVGAPAERALNQQIEAANTWGDCLAEACDLASVEPEIKRRWTRASVLLTDAQEELRGRGSRGGA